MQKILVLGGTQFLGRHFVEAALAAGHELTLFNRGSQAGLFPGVEQIHGNRLQDLGALRGRRWDAVFDASCYLPSAARRAAETLRDAVEHYCLISSISVYPQIDGQTVEGSPLAELTAAQLAGAEAQASSGASQNGGGYGAAYGGLKALCEQTVQALLPGRTLVLRPGFIVGPYDFSPRLRYWLTRLAEGGKVLAPGRPERTVRLIDARDIAGFALRLAAQRRDGVFITAGADGLDMGQLLHAANSACGGRARLRWRSDAELLAAGVQPFADLPYWLPDADNAMMEIRDSAALAAGLHYRPLAETLLDTAAWLRGEPAQAPQGLSRERELELLKP
ncbi:NAD-dependent epimerase/dehydratase family protein [Paucibacter soli]|uniref:NAD-dependent epimerase/dehydratase family protein n=1 Tax=Paucibacter soli TaxID=3133433 RepID=UPI0030AE2242